MRNEWLRRAGALLVFAGLVVGVLPLTVGATDKVTICHAAGLDGTTHYETLTIAYPAAFGEGGHFYEDGTPRAGHEQDYLGECESDTTTTLTTIPSSSTTTTTGDNSTTSTSSPEVDSTTTTSTPTTTSLVTGTTAPPASWTASSECDRLTVDFNPDQILMVLLTMYLGPFQVEIDDPILKPGTYPASVGDDTDFLLRPIGRNGYLPEPSSLLVTVSSCPETTTTVRGTATSDSVNPGNPTLPFTGSESGPIAFLGVVLLALGMVLIRAFRDE